MLFLINMIQTTTKEQMNNEPSAQVLSMIYKLESNI